MAAEEEKPEGGGSEEERLLRASSAELLPDGRKGLRIKGWIIESLNNPILRSLAREEWEEKLDTCHLPEMVFGESSLSLLHEASGIKLHFNAFDALDGWKQEALPPVEVPAAAIWKFRRNPSEQVTLDYDYTFTTPYHGSETVEEMDQIVSPLIEYCIKPIFSNVRKNIKAFRDCPSEFLLMTENERVIQNFLNDIESHDLRTVDDFTNEMREFMDQIVVIKEDYSRMGIISRFGIGKKLKDFNEKFKEKNSSNMKVNLALASQNMDSVPRREPDPVKDVTKIVGVGDAVSKIKKWVLNEDHVKFNRIGLVGKGGSGKTTLAQMILKDEKIKEDFLLLFVTVSQPVDVKMMMKRMLKQLSENTKDDDDKREMSEKINELLKGSRYFLILDDVWNLDGGWWETIKTALPEGSENCVLITSRNERIVQDMGVCVERMYEPKALDDDDGWSLFCISAETDVSEDTEMKQIGMEIVRRCCGLPLAIKLMGGVVLSNVISPPDWIKIRDSFMEYIFKNKNDSVMGSLKLSYDDLPRYRQPCLLCFGLFPEDSVIHRDTMIRWWIGEGFVPLTKDGQISVELAEKCFEELVNRSLVEVVERDYKGQVLKCKLHDLVREMLIRKGESEDFFEIGKEKISQRIIYNCDDNSTASNQISLSKNKVRAVFSTFGYSYRTPHVFTKDLLHKIFNECKYLRALDMFIMISEIEDKNTLKSIGNLKYLRYLNVVEGTLRITYLTTLKDITFTKSLLVLRLSILSIRTLPDSITELKQLIWLDVSECFDLEYLPEGLGNVSTLQVLKGFKLSPPSTTKGSSSTTKWSSSTTKGSPSISKGCRFEELRKLTKLVTLEMTRVSDNEFSDSDLTALSELDGLRHLTIFCSYTVNSSNVAVTSDFVQNLDNLVLPKKLDEVNLRCYPGQITPSWLNSKHLPRLRCLSLDDGEISSFHDKFYQGKKWGITHLELSNLHNLRGDWNVVRERLPHLKTLRSALKKFIGYSHKQTKIGLNFFPSPDEFNSEGFWRNPQKRA